MKHLIKINDASEIDYLSYDFIVALDDNNNVFIKLPFPNNEIHYIATSKVEPYNPNAFDNAIYLESEFDEITRKGVLKFDRDVTSIGYEAFYNCSGLITIKIPNTVTHIGHGSFMNCIKLNSITIPNSVISIGNAAFMNCEKLSEINIFNNITDIGEDAFINCTSLSKVNITDISFWCNIIFATPYSNPLYYAKHLYINNVEISDLIIPNNVTSISNYAFMGCDGLISITIPNNVTSIGTSAFSECGNLTTITLSNNL